MRRLFILLLILATVALLASLVLAAGSELKMPWYAVDGGGGRSSGDRDRFTLSSSIGQAVAGHVEGGSRFELEGGFLSGRPTQETRWNVYLPLVEQR